tara:strand:+ start:168 stop:608 length:441 start_codon:yes stop_codon:yes gene_type:complete
MALFAKLSADNIVENIIVVNDNDALTEAAGIAFCQNHIGDNSSVWKQTWKQDMYTPRASGQRGSYAGIGMTYMTAVRTLGVASTDIFISQQPAPSWSVGIQTAKWYPPDPPGEAPVLTDSERAAGKFYVWNETNYNSNPATAWVLT